jgi:hypothetical protein
MAFCTWLEFDSSFPFDRYQEMNDRADDHAALPDGCLTRIVGRPDGGATIIEVWRSAGDARRFSEKNTPLLAEFGMPAPTRVAAFDTAIFQTR